MYCIYLFYVNVFLKGEWRGNCVLFSIFDVKVLSKTPVINYFAPCANRVAFRMHVSEKLFAL